MKKFTVLTKTSLKEFTDATYPQGSFYLATLLRGGDVRVNGEKKRADCPLNAGDEVVYYTTAKQEEKPSHLVVYEDENVLVADKYSGVSSEALFCELGEKYLPVHRLDRNTSGLIVLAKTKSAETALTEAFKLRQVDKIYLCLAKSAFKEKNATLTAYLSKDEKNGLVRVTSSPTAQSVKIITEYEVLKSYGDESLVKVTLHTGKTHQIRAHLAFIGCPVLGDGKYGDGALNKKYGVKRQLLVAKYLHFRLSGELSYLNEVVLESSFFPELPDKRD